MEPFTSKHFEDEADEIEAVGAWAVTYAMPVIMRERRAVFISFIIRAALCVHR